MSEMLGEHSSSNAGSSPASKKADKRKQTILVITGVVGVGLTYLLWRHSTASAAAATTGTDYQQASGTSDGGTASGGADYSAAMNAIGSQLTTMQGQLQSQQSAYSSLEDEFNSKIKDLTSQVTTTQGQLATTNSKLAHDTTTIQHLESNKALQAKQISTLTKEVAGKKTKTTAAHNNTKHTKKATKK